MLFFIDLSFLFMTVARKFEAEVKTEDGVNTFILNVFSILYIFFSVIYFKVDVSL